jgi:hypothetical protein
MDISAPQEHAKDVMPRSRESLSARVPTRHDIGRYAWIATWVAPRNYARVRALPWLSLFVRIWTSTFPVGLHAVGVGSPLALYVWWDIPCLRFWWLVHQSERESECMSVWMAGYGLRTAQRDPGQTCACVPFQRLMRARISVPGAEYSRCAGWMVCSRLRDQILT